MFKDINYCEIVNEILYNLEEKLMIDEERILQVRHALHRELTYDHEVVWEELGI